MEHRPIAGFPGYTVTDTGEVWSAFGRSNGKNPRAIEASPQRKLSPGIAGSNGYEQVWLYRNEGKEKHGRFVHLLVLEAFVGVRPEGMQARHLSGNERDNRHENLTWGTPTENAADKARHGTTVRGEAIRQAKLTEQFVIEARRLAAAGVNYAEIGRRFGVHKSTIRRAVIGERWAHVEVGG